MPPGDLFYGQYQIRRLVYEGTWTKLYHAYNSHLQRHVILKISRNYDKNTNERLLQEGQYLARWPQLAFGKIHESFVLDDHRVCLALEYTPGDTLADWLNDPERKQQLKNPEVALSIAQQIARSLAILNENGLIFGELSPFHISISLDKQHQPRVMIIGLGLLVQPDIVLDTRNTNSQSYVFDRTIGLPINPATDVCTLGAILYVLLTGHHPPPKGSSALLKRHNPSLTAAIQTIINTCLQPDPSARYTSIPELEQALAKASSPEIRYPSLLSAINSNRFRIIGAAAFLIILLGGVIWRTGGEQSAQVAPTIKAQNPLVTLPLNISEIVSSDNLPPTSTLIPETPIPRPSVTASEIPSVTPTSTPPPTPRAFPTVVPILPLVPTPCAILIQSSLSSAWEQTAERLGCPIHEGSRDLWLGQQDFEGGWTFWRKDQDRMLAVYQSGTWEDYPNLWHEGDPVFTCGEQQNPPTPLMGSGKLWCTYPEVQAGLGQATASAGGSEGTIQDYLGGFIFQTGSGLLLVFFNNGYWQFAGEASLDIDNQSVSLNSLANVISHFVTLPGEPE